MTSRRKRAAQVAAIAGALCAPIAALASGQINVLQSDVSTQTYDNVRMKLVGLTLFLSSPDRKDVLEVDQRLFVFRGRRTPPPLCDDVTTRRTHAYDATRARRRLPQRVRRRRSSAALVANSRAQQVIVHLHTMRGTYISAQGTLDGMNPHAYHDASCRFGSQSLICNKAHAWLHCLHPRCIMASLNHPAIAIIQQRGQDGLRNSATLERAHPTNGHGLLPLRFFDGRSGNRTRVS